MSSTNHPASVNPSSGTTSGDAWHMHEHVAETAKLHAQKLLDEVGSVGLAQQAVQAAGEAMTSVTGEQRQTELAKSLQFESFSALVTASSDVPSNDGQHWHLTELPDTSWAVWNDSLLEAERHFCQREEALANVPHDDQFTGSSLLG